MRPTSLEEIRKAVHGIWRSRGKGGTIGAVTTDSRTARPGELYVALKGERFDGHDFLAAAAERGCLAAIVSRQAALAADLAERFSGGLIGVADPEAALGELAAWYRRSIPTHVVAVTGSNGKTTTKRMIHHILGKRFSGSASPRSFNNQIGVPLTLLAAGAADDYVVCELGTNAPGEIAALTAIARPNVAVITSVGATHLEKLGSVAQVATEKASILGGLAADGVAIVWSDSVELTRALRAHTCHMVKFGASGEADLRLTGYEPRTGGQRFQINGRLWVPLVLPGRHNATNAMAAIAVAQRFGLEQEAAAGLLADFAGVEMRLQVEDLGAIQVINDAYNANPSSMAAAADVLAELPAQRRVMIAGDMRELGEQARELHLQLGRDIAAKGVEMVIGVGELGRYIAVGAAEAGKAGETFDSVQAAGDRLAGLLRPGDTVLVKGSRAMQMERLLAPIRAAFGGRPNPGDRGPARSTEEGPGP